MTELEDELDKLEKELDKGRTNNPFLADYDF